MFATEVQNNTEDTRMWRTSIRVLRTDREGVWLIFPGMNSKVAVQFDYNLFPRELSNNFQGGYYFFGRANIGCEDAKLLEVSGPFEWEK